MTTGETVPVDFTVMLWFKFDTPSTDQDVM